MNAPIPNEGKCVRMNILLVYERLPVGGIQTLIVRISNWLVELGHDVSFLGHEEGELLQLLNNKVKTFITYTPTMALLPGRLEKFVPRATLQTCDLILSFDPRSLWDTVLISRSLPPTTRMITGVYHPRAYFIARGGRFFDRMLSMVLINHVQEKSIIFMNEPVKRSHEKKLHHLFSESKILPLAIEDHGFNEAERKRYLIVSVGRLTVFKTYNIYMIDVVRELVNCGFDVIWEIYGAGEQEIIMREKIQSSGLADRIHLRGTIAYEEMHKVMSKAYCFIGMGTALIEAGLFGIPSIPAIEGKGPASYGYLHEMRGYSVGENELEEPSKKVFDLIKKLFYLSEKEYLEECWKTRRHCERFTIDAVGARYVEVFSTAGTVRALKDIGLLKKWAYFSVAVARKLRAFGKATAIQVAKRCLPGKLEEKMRKIYRRSSYKSGMADQGISNRF